jgi:hypothetical protein
VLSPDLTSPPACRGGEPWSEEEKENRKMKNKTDLPEFIRKEKNVKDRNYELYLRTAK